MVNIRRKLKKAFTLIELVVVIAIIAILSVVSIGVYTGVTESAKKSSDVQVVTQLNLKLKADSVTEGRNKTAYEAYVDAIEIGFDLGKETPTYGDRYVWDEENDLFAVTKGEEVVAQDKTNPLTTKNHKKWIFVDTLIDEENRSQFYLGRSEGKYLPIELNLKAGFDAGLSERDFTLTYVGNDDVIIRTNTYKSTLKVNSTTGGVKHFGYLSKVEIDNVSNYVEYGTVGRLIAKEGKVKLDDKSNVVVPMQIGNASIETKDIDNVRSELVKDCGALHHPNNEIDIVDVHDLYEVCSKCGYSLRTIEGKNGLITKQSCNTIVNGEVTVERVNRAEYGKVDKIPLPNDEGTNLDFGLITSPDTPYPCPMVMNTWEWYYDSFICEHSFAYVDRGHDSQAPLDHFCFASCPKCGLTIYRGHNYLSPSSTHEGLFDVGDSCSRCDCEKKAEGAAMIVGGATYNTLKEAVKAVGKNGTATIKLLNDQVIQITGSEIEITANQHITLDLNGKQIVGWTNADSGTYLFKVFGELTVKDSSDANNDGSGKGKILTGGTSTWSWNGGNDCTNSKNSIIFRVLGKLTIENGYYEVMSPKGNSDIAETGRGDTGGSLTIKGGMFVSAGDVALRFTEKCNDINISGGFFKSRTYTVLSKCSYSASYSINISGGTFTSHDEAGFNLYVGGESSGKTIFNISGGKFMNGLYLRTAYSELHISGGSFKDISQKDEKVIAIKESIVDGYEAIQEGDYWVIKKKAS